MNSHAFPGRGGACPSGEEMRAFRSGHMAAADMEALADHLGVCTACVAAFEELAEDDPVVVKLREYRPEPTPPLDPECERLAAAARMIRLEAPDAATSMQATKPLPSREEPAPPRRFAGYELLQCIGAGGMGVVWKARHLRLNRLVAVKMIRFAAAPDGPEHERFRREGRAAARVKHPNMVEVYDADEHDGQPFLAMELVEGGTLARRLKERPPAPREAAALVRTLALAVQAAHDAGVVHRDLKPSNVLFTPDGAPKVADFGLAKMLDADTAFTRTGDVIGTPSYMAPEQARGDAARIGPRTDVYALGAILYELLDGAAPFHGGDRNATLARVLHGRLPPPAAVKGEGRDGLASVCARCLEKEPRDRYPSAAALAEDLERWLDGRPTEARRPGPLERVGRFVRRRKFLCASVAACGVGAAVGLRAWWALQPDPDGAVKDIESRLARGQAVELLGSGRTSKPAWSRVGAGTPTADRSGSDGSFQVRASTPPALLELLRDPQTDRYQIRAEVRHDIAVDVSFVGLYFGRQDYATKDGVVQAYVNMHFDDISNHKKEEIEKLNEQHPEVIHKARVPKANPLQLEAVMDCNGVKSRGGRHGLWLAEAQVVDPAGLAKTQWRAVVVRVTPDEIRVYWDGSKAPTLQIATAQVEARLRLDLDPRHLGESPYRPDVPLAFVPRGAIGLYVDGAAASFQNIRVEPLGPTD